MKTILRSLIVLLVLVQLVSCKDDDETPSPQIQIKNSSYSFEELNTCDIGSETLATNFDFEFDLEALVENANVDEVYFDLEWSDGEIEKNINVNGWSVNSNTLYFDWCFRFGSTEWFELTVSIVDENNVKSNSIKVRVDKPTDAN